MKAIGAVLNSESFKAPWTLFRPACQQQLGELGNMDLYFVLGGRVWDSLRDGLVAELDRQVEEEISRGS